MMKRKKTDTERKIEYWFALIGLIFMFFAVVFSQIQNLAAEEITFKFKSPSFSGEQTSSHYLTIENQEASRKKAIEDALQQEIEDLKREAESSTVARFIRNLESRVYAELSRQLVNNLFGEESNTSGTINLEGNQITYSMDAEFITLTVIEQDGTETIITLPINSFTF